jgi:hypothetical protein
VAGKWTFGRMGLATSAGGDGLELSGHYVMDFSGDECTILADLDQRSASFASEAAAIAAQKALREQARGYHLNTDEPVIPVTSVEDPTVDGFYRVQNVDVEDTAGTHFADGIGSQMTAELLRVPGWQAPRLEEVVSGTLRVNAHSVVIGTTIPAWAAPVGAYAVDSQVAPASVTVTGAEGAMTVLTKTSPTHYNLAPSFAVAPENFYKGACRIEQSYDTGSTWRTITADQIINTPTYVRVGNSLVRVTTTTTASKTELSVEWHDGSQWETAKVFRITESNTYTDVALSPVAVTVLHNRPESVGIRLELGSSTSATQWYLDVVLLRGSRVVSCLVARVGGLALDFGVKLVGTTEAATDITGGIRATNNDAGGNKVVIATPLAISDTDNTNGRLRINDDTFPFALACAIGGTVGNGFNETQGLVYEYLAAVDRRQSIVAR